MHKTERLIKQKTYEKPLLILRRHPIIFLRQIILFIFLAGLPYLLYLIFVDIYPNTFDGSYGYPIFVLTASLYYLAIWLFLFSNFIDYYLDTWIVTNDRIINIEQHGLFARTIAELDLYKVQDVTSDVKGIIPTFFNYGFVHIQTAGEKERFVFEQVRKPHEIRKKIIDLVEQDKEYHRAVLQKMMQP